MSSPLAELPSVPAELILCSEFHEGPVTGVLRAPALARALGAPAPITELVYGPARPAWRSEPASDRTFLASPAPAGSCQALLDACPWPERWRTAPVYDVTMDNPPGSLADLLRPFKAGGSIAGPYVIRFAAGWTSVRIWARPDRSPIPQGSGDLPA